MAVPGSASDFAINLQIFRNLADIAELSPGIAMIADPAVEFADAAKDKRAPADGGRSTVTNVINRNAGASLSHLVDVKLQLAIARDVVAVARRDVEAGRLDEKQNP